MTQYIVQIGLLVESEQDLLQIEELTMDERKKLVGHFVGMLQDVTHAQEGKFHLWGIDVTIDEVEQDELVH